MTVPSKEYLIKMGAVGRGDIIKGACEGCGEEGHERMDKGLLCGCWCNACFDKLVRECRSRSR